MERPSLWSLPQEVTQPLVCQQLKNTYLSLDILHFLPFTFFLSGSSDYTSTIQILSFTSGQRNGTQIPISISIVNDRIAESYESFFGNLSLPQSELKVSVFSDKTEIFITDNDSKD